MEKFKLLIVLGGALLLSACGSYGSSKHGGGYGGSSYGGSSYGSSYGGGYDNLTPAQERYIAWRNFCSRHPVAQKCLDEMSPGGGAGNTGGGTHGGGHGK